MGKTRYRKRRHQSEGSATIPRQTLEQIGGLSQVLGQVLAEQMPRITYQLQVHEAAIDMNLWVSLALLMKYTDADPEELLETVDGLQQEFLAIQSIVRFFAVLGQEEPEEGA